MSVQERCTSTYTIEWDGEVEAVVHTWDDFAAKGSFRRGCEELLEIIESRGARKTLIDTSRIRAHDVGDQEWLRDDWVPRTIEAGVEYTAVVYGESAVAKIDMEDLLANLDHLDYTTKMTTDVDAARAWLAER
ncbi:hypothetical protein [Halobellus rubicundus]|uniref:STAS/SEC14 domain-containing protein n=1 Tax=Halobellus rubicundus TaxID=2996466 RepID=A0ABD5MED6_9EURY